MKFHVRITLPEAPGIDLAEKIAITGFFSRARAPIHPETEFDVLRNDIADESVRSSVYE